MTVAGILIIAVGLSMDAFAVSICKGLSAGRLKLRQCLIAGLYFGIFQALMPLVGYLLGSGFSHVIEKVDHWIAFGLLSLIGANMIRECFQKEEEKVDDSFSPRAMLPLAIATSIDALAVGVTFAFLNVQILPAVSLIGATTFLFSAIGVVIGHLCGTRFKSKAELIGGITLIVMGAKILLEHLGVIG